MAQTIRLDQILINDDERFRSDLEPDGIQELVKSITDVGLLNPIIIDRTNKLLAGRRRIEAYRELKLEEIAFNYFEDLDPLQQKVVEFDENHKRRSLSWQDEAKAVAVIHKLMVDKRNQNLGPLDGGHTIGETAATLGLSATRVSEKLMLADMLENPRVAGRPSEKGALTTARREKELEFARELARRRTNRVLSDPSLRATQLGRGIIYNEDCLTVLKGMAADSVDLIITDPPWGIGFEESSQWTKKWIKTYDDSATKIQEEFVAVARELGRVLKPSRHLYLFFAIQEFEWWADTLNQAGFALRARPLIWHKTGQVGITDTYTSFRPSYEAILWGWLPGEGGLRTFFNCPINESFGYPRTENRWHENEKPTDLLDRFVEASSDAEEIIFDPYCGGGSSLVSAFSQGRFYIGCEKDEVNYQKCVQRMREVEEIEGWDPESQL